MPRIACLHTAPSNQDVFDKALAALGTSDVELVHHIRADLLEAAEQAGIMTQAVAAATQAVLLELTQDADAVLLTCSTLGPAADALADSAVPILRVDTALARAAVRQGGSVAVLCAVATTVEPTRLLFEAAARATGATQIALAQASMSAAGHSRAGPPLLTSPTAGHQAILSRCPDQSRFQERRRTVTPHDSP